jgi:hypothetical protein
VTIDNLSYFQLCDLSRILDMAEHHAMYEHAHASEVTTRNSWAIEVRSLCKQQSDCRLSAERKKVYSPYAGSTIS